MHARRWQVRFLLSVFPTTIKLPYKEMATKLPVELYHSIFAQAVALPGVDDLALNGAAYHTTQYEEPALSALLKPEQQVELLKRRLNIIRVCRYWYSMGIALLWSHLVIRIDFRSSRTIIQDINFTLTHKPKFAEYVLRFSMAIPSYMVHAFEWSLGELISRLPNLKITDCPFMLSGVLSVRHLDVVNFRQSYVGAQMPAQIPGWTNARIIRIYRAQFSSYRVVLQPVELPRLEELCVDSTEGTIQRHISLFWRTPNLTSLSINGPYDEDWKTYVTRCSPHLRRFELAAFRFGPQSMILSMPVLEDLRLNYRWISSSLQVRAPKLRRLEASGILAVTIGFVQQLDQMSKQFRGLEKVRLVDSHGQLVAWPFHLQADLGLWLQRGISVEIRG